jgi:putative hemolysin
MQEKTIDVEKFLKQAYPKSKYIPGFVMKWLKRFLLEDKLNNIVDATRHLEGFDWAKGVLDYFNIKLKVNHEHYASFPGRYIFVPNHNLGGLDGLAVFTLISRYHKAAKSLSNDYLLIIPNTRSLIIPVSRKSNSTKDFLHKVDEYYASDEQMLVFPAGLVARKVNGIVQDPKWTKSFVAKAIQHKRWIVPIYMDTKNPPVFYRNYKYRKLISKITGLKIERFFLMRQSFKHYNNTFRMNIGKPFSYEVFDKSRSHEQWAQAVRDHVYKLGIDNDFEFKS